MPADLLVYIIIVLALVVWLRNTIGTRHDDEPQRPNPFDIVNSNEDDAAKKSDNSPFLSGPNRLDDDMAGQDNSTDDPQADQAQKGSTIIVFGRDKKVELADISIKDDLNRIMKADRRFNLEQFVDNAQEAFVIVVEAFAQGDRDMLQSLLHKDVYAAFDQAISDREAKKIVQETEIQAIRRVEIVNATVQKNMAYISLRITAQEISATRDEKGEIIAGDPDRMFEMTDRWTFGHDIKSQDPVWYVYETNDDDIEAHDSIAIPESAAKT